MISGIKTAQNQLCSPVKRYVHAGSFHYNLVFTFVFFLHSLSHPFHDETALTLAFFVLILTPLT